MLPLFGNTGADRNTGRIDHQQRHAAVGQRLPGIGAQRCDMRRGGAHDQFFMIANECHTHGKAIAPRRIEYHQMRQGFVADAEHCCQRHH